MKTISHGVRLEHVNNIKVEVLAGTGIGIACKELSELAEYIQKDVGFNFNGIDLVAQPQKSANNLAIEYYRTYRRTGGNT